MNVLIVGGCGYVGSALYRHLIAAGHEVDSIDIERRGNPGIERNQFINYAHVSRFDEWDAVIVMSGVSSVGEAKAQPYSAFLGNLVHLGQLTQRLNGQPLIYASSAAVHAFKVASGGTQTTNIYDATKTAADAIIPQLYPETWALRFGTVAGPSPNMRFDTMINAMVRDGRRGRVKLANPHAWRPILAMADLLRGVEAILEGAVPPGLHDMCSFNAPIGQIADWIADRLGAEIELLPPSPTYDFVMGATRWFEPTERLGSIVDALVEHYKAEGIV